MKKQSLFLVTLLIGSVTAAVPAAAQVVAVTMSFDNSTIPVGGSTKLHVYAQVVAAQRTNSERIFSWYIDVLNSTTTVAQPDYSQVQKPTSDKNPSTSSSGTTQGGNRTGIYDTFITDSPVSKSGTGVSTPVELFNVPIQGLLIGQTTFRVTPGSGAASLAEDFIVAPLSGSAPLLGGIYDAASAVLQVSGTAPCRPLLSAAYTPGGNGTNRVTLSFSACPGQTNIVEYRDSLVSGSWQALPGAPHNSGFVTDTNGVATRFYRVRTGP